MDGRIRNRIGITPAIAKGTGKPPQFIVFNTDSGKVVTSLPCVGVNSDMSFDVARKRIYVTGSDTASVF
jgi:hypothetical protein